MKKKQSWLVGEEEVTGKKNQSLLVGEEVTGKKKIGKEEKKNLERKKKPSYIPLRYRREKKKGYQNVGFHSGFRKKKKIGSLTENKKYL